MQTSRSPKIFAMMGLSTLAVELPFFISMMLIQVWVQCEHCREVWRTFWPILGGMIPSYLVGFRYGGWWFFAVLGLVTCLFIGGVFLLSFRNRYWFYVLLGGGIVSSLLAVLTYALIAS